MTQRIFLDHASSTFVIPPAREALAKGLSQWANPNSPHAEGRRAQALLEEARQTIADVLGWRHDVVFTSGASESVELAARCAAPPGRAHGATEHKIVGYAMGEELAVIPVDSNGLIDEAALDAVLAKGPALIAIQQVNNETGVVQPLDRLAPKIRDSGSLLLADCAQSASKLPLPGADFIAICAHKLGGPPGIGALLVRDLATLRACGGGQEKGYRRGTQDMPGALSFAAAIAARPYDMAKMKALRGRLEAGVKAAGGVVIAENAPRVPTIGAISLPGASSAALLAQLDLAGIGVSAGSACSSGKAKPSDVLAAMGVREDIGAGFLRISFGPQTSEADVDGFVAEFRNIAREDCLEGGMTYLDYQATTPLAPEVAAAMRPWIDEKFANPHSPSRDGREAAAAIEVARTKVEAAIGLKGGSLAFTGSATEAINWAIKGTIEKAAPGRNRIVTVRTEHAAVLDTCEWLEGRGADVTYLPAGSDGLLNLDDVEAALDDRVALVAVMLVNNEIGVIQPVGEIAKMAHKAGAQMLCDAVQALGRVAIPEGPDLVAVSAHKIHGPKGIGALWMRNGAEPAPLIHGGGQEQGRRSGTLSPALVAGFGAAAKLAAERFDSDRDHTEMLWGAALRTLGGGWTINGNVDQRYHGNLNIRREGIDATRIISDLRDIAFALGSACASGSGRPSHVLRAIGLSDREARSSIRIGFGRYTSVEELVGAIRRINEAAEAQERFAA